MLSEDTTLILMDRGDHERVGYGKFTEVVARLLGKGENCVVEESHLTTTSFRKEFVRFCDLFLPNIKKDWVFFESDPLRCLNNVYHDFKVATNREYQHKSRIEAVLNQVEQYEIPNEQDLGGGSLRTKKVVCSNYYSPDLLSIRSMLEEAKESL